nr:unnamed protein product [Spirometra erinaceieuropaei]
MSSHQMEQRPIWCYDKRGGGGGGGGGRNAGPSVVRNRAHQARCLRAIRHTQLALRSDQIAVQLEDEDEVEEEEEKEEDGNDDDEEEDDD